MRYIYVYFINALKYHEGQELCPFRRISNPPNVETGEYLSFAVG